MTKKKKQAITTLYLHLCDELKQEEKQPATDAQVNFIHVSS
jgi:hypothetical protein